MFEHHLSPRDLNDELDDEARHALAEAAGAGAGAGAGASGSDEESE